MRNIFKSIKLDHAILKSYYKTMILYYVIGTVVGTISQNPAIAIAIVTIITAPFSGTYFSVYEKNNLNKLYGILPLNRSEVVIGRYLFALMIGVMNAVISIILAYILSYFVGSGISRLDFILYSSISFVFFCIFIGILFPLYNKFAFSKIYLYANLPIYILGVLGVFIVKRTNILKNIGQTLQYFNTHQNMIWITCIGIGLILLLLSCTLSIMIYRKTEL